MRLTRSVRSPTLLPGRIDSIKAAMSPIVEYNAPFGHLQGGAAQQHSISGKLSLKEHLRTAKERVNDIAQRSSRQQCIDIDISCTSVLTHLYPRPACSAVGCAGSLPWCPVASLPQRGSPGVRSSVESAKPSGSSTHVYSRWG